MTYSNHVYPVRWQQDHVLLIDQNRLPEEYTLVDIHRYADMVEAIKTMIVRGAPAIGIAAAYGLCLGANEIQATDVETFLAELEAVAEQLRQTRPTAVNLFWALNRMMQGMTEAARSPEVDVAGLRDLLVKTAEAINVEDLQTCQAIGDAGLAVLPSTPEALRILTHCNAGALATGGYGTALGVVRSAWREHRLDRVYASETRPRFQGARLTAWECIQEEIPVTVITDSMAAHCMKLGMVDAVVVGADRIAANGDTANKIGTYSLALLAQAHNLPFFVAAPLSTIDFELTSGDQIPIEERDPAEVYQVGDLTLCPRGTEFYNPAFDVTPAALIAAIITEKGAIPPSELQAKLASPSQV